jgi:predicted RNA-binding protein YlxR (DUF448 family)
MEQVRTCVGCRQRETRKSLIRLVLVNSKVSVDEGKKLPGRGAWLHAKTECLQLALNRKALGRAFKQQFEADEQVLALAIEQAEAMMAKNE